jgi:hypothetical protein
MSGMSSYRRKDRSLRLTFRFRGDDISLVDRREVDMLAPPSDELDGHTPKQRSGFWLELQSSDGRTLYRRVIRHPIRANAEVALDEGGFTNKVAVADQGAFSLVVPNLAEAADLALFASPLDQPHLAESARELVRVPVRKPRGDREPKGEDEPDRPYPGDRPDQEHAKDVDRFGDDGSDRPDQAGPTST